jgi:hypothetical protein
MTCSSSVPIADVSYPISFMLGIPDTAVLGNRIDQAPPDSHSCCLDRLLRGRQEVVFVPVLQERWRQKITSELFVAPFLM